MFEYSAKLERIVDGDSVDVTLDLGFDVTIGQRLRLNKIQAQELDTNDGIPAMKMLACFLYSALDKRTLTFVDKLDQVEVIRKKLSSKKRAKSVPFITGKFGDIQLSGEIILKIKSYKPLEDSKDPYSRYLCDIWIDDLNVIEEMAKLVPLYKPSQT